MEKFIMSDKHRSILAEIVMAFPFKLDMDMLIGIARGSIETGCDLIKFDRETHVLYVGIPDIDNGHEVFLADDVAERMAKVWKHLIPGLRFKYKKIERV